MAYLDWGDPQYEISLYLTIAIIITKFSLSAVLWKRTFAKKRESGIIKLDFLTSMAIFLIFLGISRALYFYYDFYLTHFDSNLLWVKPNIYYWKVATFISAIPGAFVIYALDRQVYQFKFKGIFSILLVIASVVQFILPIESEADFNFVSQIGVIASLLGAIIPLTFFYLAIKSSGQLRRVALLMTIGILLYALASALMSEPILVAIDNAFGAGSRMYIIVAVPVTKILGLILLTYGVSKFQI